MSRTLSGKYATPLSLEPQPSRQLGILLAMTHAAALALLPYSQLPVWLIIPLALILLMGYRHSRRTRILHRHPGSIRRLVWGSGNDWRLTLGSGKRVRARLRPFAFVHPRLVILHFRRADGRASHIVLPADSLDPLLFRRLRVRLQIELSQIAGSADA